MQIINANGETTKFNFKFDNGLDVKPIISTTCSQEYAPDEGFYFLEIYFLKKEEVLQNFNLSGVYYFKDTNELWLLIDGVYIVITDILDIIISELENKRLVCYFFGVSGELLKGSTISD